MIFVYINEAHAMDEWPIRTKSQLCIKQHQTLQDRCVVAKSLIHDYSFEIPVYVDTMENLFQTTYAAWPLRAYIFQEQNISFILQPKLPGYYDLKEIGRAHV